MSKKFYLFFLAAVILFIPHSSLAEDSFFYKKSEGEIWINQDSTIDVIEKDAFVLNGTLDKLSRQFRGERIDYFSNLEISDPAGKQLEKRDYTFSNSKSKAKSSIEWLIPKNTYVSQGLTYTLKYKVYGALSFLADHDELVWDLMSYGSDLGKVEVAVHLPKEIKKEDLKMGIDTNAITVAKDIFKDDKSVYDIIKNNEFARPVAAYYLGEDNSIYFIGQNLKKDSFFNVIVGWPKGIVTKQKVSYGQLINWLIGSGVIIIFMVYIFYYRYFGKKKIQTNEDSRADANQTKS